MPYSEYSEPDPVPAPAIQTQGLSNAIESVPTVGANVSPDIHRHPDTGVLHQSIQPKTGSGMKKRKSTVTVSSHNRDRSLYPNLSSYTVKFSDTDNQAGHVIGMSFKNVYSVELISAVYPNTNSAVDEPYLALVIDELDTSSTFSNNQALDNAFARLFPFDVTVAAGKFIYNATTKNKIIFRAGSTLASLDRITISIRTVDNALFNFGVDAVPPAAPTKNLQNYFTFRITTLECDTAELGTNAIF